MRKKILAGNWKMNKSIAEIKSYFTELDQHIVGGIKSATSQIEVVIAAPYLHFGKALDATADLGITIAAQNVHWELAGAFTGEISPNMLKECGVRWSLVGHSERRQYFAETDLTVEKKVRSALKAGLVVIACVGEVLAERETGKTVTVVTRQVEAILAGADGDLSQLIIAYEPVWAIGTGLAATAAQAQEVHQMIRSLIAKHRGQACANALRILYGGSMSPANTSELLAKEDIDGGLIGGASLKAKDFAEMIKTALR